MRANDLIIGVAQDGQPMVDVVGWSVHEIVSVIRGARGTSVTIKVKQPNTPDSSARNVVIVRDVIAQFVLALGCTPRGYTGHRASRGNSA